MTPKTAEIIAAALNTKPFQNAHLSSATLNAQDALSGITHYCDALTLRFHHSRIVGASVASCGAFFKIIETCSQDYENTRRGYRVVLFDLTGKPVYHPSLDELTRTRQQADKAFYAWFNEFDELNHYREKMNQLSDKKAREIAVLNECARMLAAESEAVTA